MKKVWSDEAWSDYVDWQSQDKKTLKKINQLLKDRVHFIMIWVYLCRHI